MNRPRIVDPTTGEEIRREQPPTADLVAPVGRNAWRRKIEPDTLEKILTGYAAGRGIRALVTETGVPYGTIHARLRHAGLLRDRVAGAAAMKAWRQNHEDAKSVTNTTARKRSKK